MFDTERMRGDKQEKDHTADDEENEDLCISFHLILYAAFLAVIRVSLIL